MWEDGGGGRTTLSVFEIGGHHLRRILLPDDLRGYITPGQPARIMIGRGLSRGLISRPCIAAVETRAGTRKIANGLAISAAKIGVYSLVLGGMAALHSRPLALAACAAIAGFYIKDYLQLKSF